MIKIRDNSLIVIAFAMMLFICGCRKQAPVLTTNELLNITATSFESGGEILHNSGSKITSCGICWDTISNPTTEDRKTTDSLNKEQFLSSIKGLFPNTTYYIRAYAVNEIGTGYGDQLSFTTPKSVPVIKTSEITDITSDSARSGGIIYSDGGSSVINSGICWDTVANPAISGFKADNITDARDFTSDISGLKPNTTYFVRAYATNSMGTSYGEELKFNTPVISPLVTTAYVSEKYLYSASCSVSLKSDGGNKVIEYGVCWNTKPDPTTDNFKTSKPYARGKFRLTNLKAGTKYYARSYAINSEGTGYGRVIIFRTLGSKPKIKTLPAFNLTSSGASVKAIINPGFLPTDASIEYGINEDYGQLARLASRPFKGKADTTITAQLSGMKSGTTYHFRVKAENALGTSYGEDMTFLIMMIPELKGFSPITKNFNDSTFFITPPSSNSPGAITYSSSNPDIATLNGQKGIIKGSGTCIITASQAPAGVFAAGSISTTFSMNVVDIDGNIYPTVSIGDQDWMKQNLRVTRYRNGDPIPNVTDNNEWMISTSGGYSWINNDTANRNNPYGALYNWFAVTDSRKICPTGWHVPTDAEWQVMERFLGMTFAEAEETVLRGINQGLLLKDTVGWIKNGTGTNTSNFSALPAGLRAASNGNFYNNGIDACWWTSTEEDTNKAWLRNIYYYFNSIYRIPDSKNFGFSVRCVRDRKR